MALIRILISIFFCNPADAALGKNGDHFDFPAQSGLGSRPRVRN